MAGDLTFRAELEDKVSPALQKIQREVEDTVGVFVKLRTAVLSIGFGSLIGSAVQYAAAIDDVATATGMATENVLGFAKAFQQFGGSTEGALTGIARFNNAVADAAQGNKQAQENFERLGISLKDLEYLSEQDLLRKTIQGLAELPKGAEATATAMSILGKEAAKVDFKSVNDGLDQFIEKSRSTAEAVRAAAEAEEKFGIAQDTFKTSLLAALEPIAKFLAGLDPKAIEEFMKITVELGKALLIFYAVDKISSVFKNFSTAMTAAGSAGNGFATVMSNVVSATTGGASSLGLLTTGVKNLGWVFANLGMILGGSNGLNTILSSLMRNFGRIGAGLAGLAAVGAKVYLIFQAINLAVGALTGNSIVDWAERAAKALGLITQTSKEKAAEDEAEKKRLEAKQKLIQDQTNEEEKKRKVQAHYQEQLDKERATLGKNLQNYKDSTEQYRKQFDQATKALTLSEEQKLVEEERLKAEERYLNAIKPLQERINEIKSKGNNATEVEKRLLPEIQGEINKITAEYKKQESLREKDVKDRVKQLLAAKELVYQAELLTQAEQRRLLVDESIRNVTLRSADEANRRWNDFYKSTLPPLQKAFADINDEAEKLSRDEAMKIALSFTNADGEIVDPEGFARALGELDKRVESLKKNLQGTAVKIDTGQLEQLRKVFETKIDTEGIKQLRTLEDQRAALTMTPLQKEYQKIDIAARESAEAELQAYAQRQKILRSEIPPNIVAEYYDIATKKSNELKESQKESSDYAKSFSVGWTQAFIAYREAATDASKQAAAIFNKTVQGMEDLFVNFAKTGKFEWKKFVNDLGEEILRSQLRELFSGMFGDMTKAMSSGEGFMGSIGKLLGFGDSKGTRNNPMYTIDVGSGSMASGAQSGGLWDGIKSIGSSIWDGVKSIGSSILGAFGGGSSGGGFFSSIVKGIGSLFGGFFANGGTLGAGRWGIAGERGPELITGPATVSPMMGTNVNYYISAVDASSFQQLVARDPSFIHAVAMKGAKGMARR